MQLPYGFKVQGFFVLLDFKLLAGLIGILYEFMEHSVAVESKYVECDPIPSCKSELFTKSAPHTSSPVHHLVSANSLHIFPTTKN